MADYEDLAELTRQHDGGDLHKGPSLDGELQAVSGDEGIKKAFFLFLQR